jgi:hypothetical protein
MLSLHIDVSLSVLATQSVRSALRGPDGQLRMQMLTGTDSSCSAAERWRLHVCSRYGQLNGLL